MVQGAGGSLDKTSPAGEAVTAGHVVYKKASDRKWWKAQSDGTAEESGVEVAVGIALHGAAANQPLTVLTAGSLAIGATVVLAMVYVASVNPGGICPLADMVATNKLTIVGYGSTTGVLTLAVHATGVAK